MTAPALCFPAVPRRPFSCVPVLPASTARAAEPCGRWRGIAYRSRRTAAPPGRREPQSPEEPAFSGLLGERPSSTSSCTRRTDVPARRHPARRPAPPAARPAPALARRPGTPHRPRRTRPAPLARHVVGLVRAAIPPMHPGGRPIVAGVAAAAGLLRVVTGRGDLARRARHRRHRRVLPRAPSGAAAAAPASCSPRPTARWPRSARCRRPPSWTCPPYLSLGSASSCPCWTCTCSGCRSRGGSWPWSTGRARSSPPTSTRPARTTSATRVLIETAGGRGSASCRSRGCWRGGSSATSPSATRWRRARPTG